MNQENYDSLLAHFLRYRQNEDCELWIVIDYVAKALDINVKKMTIEQGEELWAGLTKLITMMLQNGFVAFDFVKDFQRQPWAEQDPKQVMTKIRNKWVDYKGEFPNVGFIVWFYRKNAKPHKQ